MVRRYSGPASLKVVSGSTSTGTSDGESLGGAFGLFGIQVVKTTGGSAQSEAEVHLQGSLDGSNWTNIGATNAWSTAQDSGTIVQVQSSAPVTHARVEVSKNTSTNAIDVYVCAMPSVST